jgi:hypothetical protein
MRDFHERMRECTDALPILAIRAGTSRPTPAE